MKQKDKDRLRQLTGGNAYTTGQAQQNMDGTWTIVGDLNIVAPFDQSGVRFKQLMGGTLHATGAGLTTLDGFPTIVQSSCFVGDNQLTSLEGAPRVVSLMFSCKDNQLASLEGAPNVAGMMNVSSNMLTTLEYLPKNLKLLIAADNPFESLSHLEGSGLGKIQLDWQPKLGLLPLLYCQEVDILGGPKGTPVETIEKLNSIFKEYQSRGIGAVLEVAAELANAGFKDNVH